MLRATLLILALSTTSLAQPPAPAPAPQPDKPAAQPTPAPTLDKPASQDTTVQIWTEARFVLQKELDTVKALKSVKGSNTTHWQDDVEGKPPISLDYPLDYAVAKPNKLFMETKDLKVFADGTTLTIYSKALHQFLQRPMPELYELRDTLEKLTDGQIRGIPGEPILRPGMSLEQTLRNVRTVDHVSNGELDGRRGSWVSGTAIDDRQPNSIPFTFKRWYSDADGLCYRIEQDWTAMYQDIASRDAAEKSEGELMPTKPDRFLQVGMTTTYKRELNPTLPPSTFTFTPAKDDQRVDSFIWPRPSLKEQVAMLGHPCPPVAGKDFGAKNPDGSNTPPVDVDVAAHRGKVVVLDFWALWCPHCLEALPSMQAIKDQYGDKLMLIGVNNDKKGDEDRVRKFLLKHGLTIQQLNDIPETPGSIGGPVAQTFHVQSWPCVVVIDQQGNVADIEVGYLPGKEKELQAKIDTLLSGKPLRTPEELSKLQNQVGLNNN